MDDIESILTSLENVLNLLNTMQNTTDVNESHPAGDSYIESVQCLHAATMNKSVELKVAIENAGDYGDFNEDIQLVQRAMDIRSRMLEHGMRLAAIEGSVNMLVQGLRDSSRQALRDLGHGGWVQ